MADGTTTPQRIGETEFILLMALISTITALAIDMLLPGFGQMRQAFGLGADSTAMSLTITVFFVGSGIGNLVYGPLSDSWGRKPVLLLSLGLYGGAALASALAPTLTVLLITRFLWGLGTGGPRVLSQAIVRDRFSGTAMARVMSLIQAAFFVGPVVAPLLGAGLLAIGSWRWIMGFGVVSAAVAALWSLRMGETLAPSQRRPLDPRLLAGGFAIVARCPTTTLMAASLVFMSGAFYSFLGSTEFVFAEIFHRAELFVPYFSAMGLTLGVISLAVNRVLRRMPASRLTVITGGAMVVFSAATVLVSRSAGGQPSFVLWLALFSLSNACAVVMFPSAFSLALEPMGEVAGTAASVISSVTTVVGAALAAVTDRTIAQSVAPMAVAYLVYGSISLGFQLLALRNQGPLVSPRTD